MVKVQPIQYLYVYTICHIYIVYNIYTWKDYSIAIYHSYLCGLSVTRQWPVITFAAVFGMFAGILASIVESLGDYSACAKLCEVPPPPRHAVNRGIFVEGVGCVLSGLWGTGSGTGTYSGNIVAIGMTRVLVFLIYFFKFFQRFFFI